MRGIWRYKAMERDAALPTMDKIETSLTKVNKRALWVTGLAAGGPFLDPETCQRPRHRRQVYLISHRSQPPTTMPDECVWSARKNLGDQTSRHSLRALIELSSPLCVVGAVLPLVPRG